MYLWRIIIFNFSHFQITLVSHEQKISVLIHPACTYGLLAIAKLLFH